ncbi:MAG: polysaccharide pyruvyl transferase family protein [Butyrivibrio sp.]|nr:polysaccharide pyruvyl transferase family protein [Butyrivibrio sp.]
MQENLDNKKIGLITFHDTTNFGATLQTVGLYKAIKELGLEIEIINYHCAEIDRREIPKYNFIASNNKIKWLILYILGNYKNTRKHRMLHKFLKKETTISSKKYNKKNIVFSNNEYDCYVIGSDMLWNTSFTKSDYTYMLDFAGGVNKNMHLPHPECTNLMMKRQLRSI